MQADEMLKFGEFHAKYDWVKSLPGNIGYAEAGSIHSAAAFAIAAHGDQKYGQDPYMVHLRKVFGVLCTVTEHVPLLQAAWLHDVLEDTKTTWQQIAFVFGIEVAQLVFAVTNEPGKNRAERNARTYPKIRENEGAILLKMADRIANVEHSAKGILSEDPAVAHTSRGLFQMYLKEEEGFTQGLFTWATLGDGAVGRLSSRLNNAYGLGQTNLLKSNPQPVK